MATPSPARPPPSPAGGGGGGLRPPPHPPDPLHSRSASTPFPLLTVPSSHTVFQDSAIPALPLVHVLKVLYAKVDRLRWLQKCFPLYPPDPPDTPKVPYWSTIPAWTTTALLPTTNTDQLGNWPISDRFPCGQLQLATTRVCSWPRS